MRVAASTVSSLLLLLSTTTTAHAEPPLVDGPDFRHFRRLTHAAPAPADLEPSFNLYVPLPDEQLLDEIFEKINPEAQSPVTSMISVAVPTDGTVVWYDHWEDGYDSDLTQSSTKVWGDGDASNGCAPIEDRACTDETDIFHAGDVVLLKNDVDVDSRNPDVIKYDGGDLIRATYPVVMTRAGFPAGPGSMMAGAVEMRHQSTWGTSFEAPVGEDISHDTRAYEFTAMAVMAGEDGTAIKINGVYNQILDQGGSGILRVDQSDVITSSHPVQVHLITGDISSTYELRWYALAPTSQWSTTAYAPVGDTRGETKVTIYNPSTTSIQVEVTYTGGQSDTITVPTKGHAMTDIIQDNVGAKFESEDVFFAFSSTDTEGSGVIFDWGYPLMTGEMLTPQIVIGLGFGCTGNSCDHNGERSIVWVMSVDDAELWIDYDNDGISDKHITSDALQTHMLTDDNDEDMTGAVIWATTLGSDSAGSGVNLAGAWGQKAALSGNGDSRALDLGTVVVPFEPTYTSCSIDMMEDHDGNGVISTGDLVRETIEVLNVGNFAVNTNSYAVSTGGGVVNLDPMEMRGDTAIYMAQYLVPVGETVLGTCELVPYEPDAPVAPESTLSPTTAPTDNPTLSPTTGSPTTAPTEEPTSSPTTNSPTTAPTEEPTSSPTTNSPTKAIIHTGSSFGDPHVKTWGGDQFDFHGACDLVLVKSPFFANDKGMTVHIRTKIQTWWSYIDKAVIKIGDDTLEVQGGHDAASYWINGVKGSTTESGQLEHTIAGYPIHFKNKSKKLKTFLFENLPQGNAISVETFNDFVRVNIRADNENHFKGSLGLMGAFPTGAKVARDGKTVMEDTDAFGQEWQVRASEARLFHNLEGAQHPASCTMPTTTERKSRRLGESLLDLNDAKAACARVSEEFRDACVFDVLATNDKDMAGSY